MKQSKNPNWRKSTYLGCASTSAGNWNLFCAKHYLERAKERSNTDYMENIFHFAEIFEDAFSNDSFMNFALLHAKTYNNEGQIVLQRFQIRDRGRNLSHIFEIEPRLREVYLVTVYSAPTWQKNVFAKRGCIILDVAPANENAEIVMSLYDWRFENCKKLLERMEISARI